MKEFIKKWLVYIGLASVSASIIPAIVNDYWEAAIFTFQLLFALFVVCLLQLLTDRISLKFTLLKYLIDLVITLLVALSLGWIWNWYEPSYVWMMFAMVIPCSIIAYFLDLVKVNKEVKAINQRIKRRHEKLQREKGVKADDC